MGTKWRKGGQAGDARNPANHSPGSHTYTVVPSHHHGGGGARCGRCWRQCWRWAIALALYAQAGAHIETFIQLSSANFLATYVLIFIAAWRLLRGRELRASLIVATVAVIVLVATSLPSLWYAAVTTVVFTLVVMVKRYLPLRLTMMDK